MTAFPQSVQLTSPAGIDRCPWVVAVKVEWVTSVMIDVSPERKRWAQVGQYLHDVRRTSGKVVAVASEWRSIG